MATASSALRTAIVALADTDATIGAGTDTSTFYVKPPSSPRYPHIVFRISESEVEGIDPRNTNQGDGTSNRKRVADLTILFTVATRHVESAQDMGHTIIDTWFDALRSVLHGVVPSVSGWSPSAFERQSGRTERILENTTEASETYLITLMI